MICGGCRLRRAKQRTWLSLRTWRGFLVLTDTTELHVTMCGSAVSDLVRTKVLLQADAVVAGSRDKMSRRFTEVRNLLPVGQFRVGRSIRVSACLIPIVCWLIPDPNALGYA
jgi:hypothetical protein